MIARNLSGFEVFCGSQSHAFPCKHVIHDLLTLVSSIYKNNKKEGMNDAKNRNFPNSNKRNR